MASLHENESHQADFIPEEFAKTIDPSGDTDFTDTPTQADCSQP